MARTAAKKRWPKVAFGDVVRLSKERSRNPEEDGFERFIGLEHIDPCDLKVRRWGDIADGVTFTNVFLPGQVLFGKRRAYQRKVAVADFSGVCSGDIYVFEPKDGRLLPELLPFLCQTDAFFEHAVGTSAGSLSPRTNWKSLADFKFALPPLEEQRRIVRLLQAHQATVESSVQLAARLCDLRASLIEHLVGTRSLTRKQGLDTTGNSRKGWKPLRLSQVANIVRGSTPRPAQDPKYFGGTHIPWITVGELTKDDFIHLDKTDSMLTAEGAKRSRIIPVGTVVLSNSGFSLGIPKVLRLTGCANDGVAAFLDLDARLNPLFLYYWLLGLTEYLRKVVAAGGDQPNLNTQRIGDLVIATPPGDEQSRTVHLLTQVDGAIRHSRQRITDLQAYSRQILSELLMEPERED